MTNLGYALFLDMVNDPEVLDDTVLTHFFLVENYYRHVEDMFVILRAKRPRVFRSLDRNLDEIVEDRTFTDGEVLLLIVPRITQDFRDGRDANHNRAFALLRRRRPRVFDEIGSLMVKLNEDTTKEGKE